MIFLLKYAHYGRGYATMGEETPAKNLAGEKIP